ncbi:unnamed protein product [Gadus morhua 'NCC']
MLSKYRNRQDLEKRACVSTTDHMPQGAAEAEPCTTGKGKRSLGSFFKSKAVPPSSSTTQLEDAINAEVDNYLMTPTINGEEDPQPWWRMHNEEDPGLGTSAHGAAEGAARRTQSRRRGSSASSMRPQDHPFLQLQQTGFDMLERELAGMRRDTNTRLDRVAMLLRPLGRIASSLDRIATAKETCMAHKRPTSSPCCAPSSPHSISVNPLHQEHIQHHPLPDPHLSNPPRQA